MYFYLISACTILLGLSGFADKIPDTSKAAFLKSLGFKIPFYLIVTIGSIWASHVSDEASKQEQAKSAAQQEDKLRERDSVHRRRDDSLETDYGNKLILNNNKNLETFTDVLAKYNLKYVAEQNKITSYLKDSTTKEIPDLGFYTPAVKYGFNATSDSFNINIPFRNEGNCPIIFSIFTYTAVGQDSKLYFVGKNLDARDEYISQRGVDNIPMKYFMRKIPDRIYFWFKGQYSNISKTKVIPIDWLFSWDKKANDFGYVSLVSVIDSVKRFCISHQ
jgi:hypothetical protein